LVLEINHKREFFTQHGLHLNGRGKEEVAKQLVTQISTILGKKIEGPISLGWKSDLVKEDTTIVLENRNETLKNRQKEMNQGGILDSDETNDSGGGVDNVKLPKKQPSPPLISDKTINQGDTLDSDETNDSGGGVDNAKLTRKQPSPPLISEKRTKKKPVTRTNDFLWEI
jgi:hypothetical protein